MGVAQVVAVVHIDFDDTPFILVSGDSFVDVAACAVAPAIVAWLQQDVPVGLLRKYDGRGHDTGKSHETR